MASIRYLRRRRSSLAPGNRSGLSRRGFMLLAGATGIMPRAFCEVPLPGVLWTRRLNVFLGRSPSRPAAGWLNQEDLIYHDLSYPAVALNADPEIAPFMDRVWVFNRTMTWLEHQECVLCYSSAAELWLTGAHQASQWHSDPQNEILHEGSSLRFTKRSTLRACDAVVLPAFQFHLRQHPTLRLEVFEAHGEWQLLISIKGRAGMPFFCSAWRAGAAVIEVNIADLLASRGYDLNYAELHFVIAVSSPQADVAASIQCQMALMPQAAVIGCLPVIRSRDSASGGMPIVAVVVDSAGRLLDAAANIRVFAKLARREFELSCSDGIWSATAKGLEAGDHRAQLSVRGAPAAGGHIDLRITDGRFVAYDRERSQIMKGGRMQGPLSGSFQGTFFFHDAGGKSERMIQGQNDWDAWDREARAGARMHYWESLTAAELDERFAYLRKCGWDALHLCQHWGIWERLDAGGRIAPHGAEQLALYLRTASRHDLCVLQALSHYPYKIRTSPDDDLGTVPYSAYIEAGFRNEDWFEPRSDFTGRFHNYLRQFVRIFRDETALLGMSASGEGDATNGLPRSTDTFEYVRALDPNHLFIGEPVFELNKLPEHLCAGWNQDLLGSRAYWIGESLEPLYDLGIEFKVMQKGRLILSEGNWPAPPRYVRFHFDVLSDEGEGAPVSWAGTPRYRIRLRDTLYLGLVHRIPLLLTWDEQVAEDEHLMLHEIRSAVDWSQPFGAPPVVIRITESHLRGVGRRALSRYEEALSGMGLASGLLFPGEQPVPGTAIVLDAAVPFDESIVAREGAAWAARVAQRVLAVSSGYCVYSCRSSDGTTVLAYVCNITGHVQAEQALAGRLHRAPTPTELHISVDPRCSETLRCRVYDLNEKTMVRAESVRETASFFMGVTDHDFFVLLTPAGSGA